MMLSLCKDQIIRGFLIGRSLQSRLTFLVAPSLKSGVTYLLTLVSVCLDDWVWTPLDPPSLADVIRFWFGDIATNRNRGPLKSLPKWLPRGEAFKKFRFLLFQENLII